MGVVTLILWVFAFVLFFLAAFEPWSRPWWPPHLGWLAAAAVALAVILGSAASPLAVR